MNGGWQWEPQWPPKRLLAISTTWPGGEEEDETASVRAVVWASAAAPVQRRVECAGAAWERWWHRRRRRERRQEKRVEGEEEEDAENGVCEDGVGGQASFDGDSSAWSDSAGEAEDGDVDAIHDELAAKYAHLRRTHRSIPENHASTQHDDYYALLGLEQWRWRAGVEDIRKAYKRASLHCHPDKTVHLSDAERDASLALFKRLQRALTVLTDPRQRLAYDSVDDVDDSLPDTSLVQCEADFYAVYGPVFARNARWSRHQPVPSLGHAHTPLPQVLKFYAFWRSFESWRQFPDDAEYDVSQAESRDERRWMERMNHRQQRQRREEERSRLARLVEGAYRLDPRIQAMQARERAERERSRTERQRAREARQREAQEQQRQWEEQRQRERAAEQQRRAEAKRQRERERDARRKLRQALRALAARTAEPEVVESMERIIERCGEDTERLRQLERACRPRDGDVEALRAVLARMECVEREQEKRREEAQPSPSQVSESVSAPSAEWTAEHLSLLARAAKKFPPGTRDRWIRIAEFMRHAFTPEEVQAQWKRLQPSTRSAPAGAAANGAAAPTAASTPPNAAQWSVSEQARLEAALKQHASTLGDARWARVAADVHTRSAEACRSRFEELAAYFRAQKHPTTR